MRDATVQPVMSTRTTELLSLLTLLDTNKLSTSAPTERVDDQTVPSPSFRRSRAGEGGLLLEVPSPDSLVK